MYSETQACINKWTIPPFGNFPLHAQSKQMVNVSCAFKMVPKWLLLQPQICAVDESQYLHQSGQSVVLCVCSVQLPRSIYDSYFKGECRLWKKLAPWWRALRMQENVPACTHTHDAPNLTPTAFVTRCLSVACFCIRVIKYWRKKKLCWASSFLKNPGWGQNHFHSYAPPIKFSFCNHS